MYIITFLMSPASASLYQLMASVLLCYGNLYSSLFSLLLRHFLAEAAVSSAALIQMLYDYLLLNNQLKSSEERN